MALTKDQEIEIERLRAEKNETVRPIAPALEELLYHPIPVLDQGFVRVVDYMGTDESIVQAARVSYGKGTKRTSEDRGLINYLLRHRHTTPFEMCEIKFHVKLPIFVARQWIRHRTANVNEYSARYSILDKEFYVPDLEFLKNEKSQQSKKKVEQKSGKTQIALFESDAVMPSNTAAQSKVNKQGREEVLSPDAARDVLETIKRESSRAYTTYTKLLNEDASGQVLDPNRIGIARELARMVLPANIYTQWYWKIDLHNLMHFVSLRADSHAQEEIRAYAAALLHVMDRWVPITSAACREHILGGVRLSATGLEVVKRLIKGEKVAQADSGLQPREWRELAALLGIDPA